MPHPPELQAGEVTPPHPHPPGRHDFPAMDAGRGLVALAVVGYHAAAVLQIHAFFEFAFLGVDFFFMLSGFVVAHAYEKRLQGGGFLGEFARIRLLRLYPMIVLGTLVGFLLTPPAHAPLQALGLGLLMVPRLWAAKGEFIYPLDPALWSLFFELLANLVFALCVRRAGVRTLIAVCVGSLPLIVLGRSFHVGFLPETFPFAFPRTALSFSLGLLLHRAYRAGRLPDWGRWAPALLTAVFAVLMLPLPMSHDRFPILFLYVLLLFPAAIAACAGARPGPRTARLCRAAGELSYPLYALHVPVVQAAGMAAMAAHVSPGRRLGLMLGLMAVLPPLAWAVGRLVDAPVRRTLGRRLRLRAPARLAAAAP